jgi:NAD(P)-dependent dehydrogenase (short-subunit alcohol dehydrogenase family)
VTAAVQPAILEEKVAIVTGAGRGIGRGIALVLARAGAVVVAADIDLAAASETAARAVQAGFRSVARQIDIADVGAIGEFVGQVVAEFGTIDILVNNAGVTRRIDFFDIVQSDMDWITDINIRGTFFMMQGAARVMRDHGGGRIVNISSIAGKGYKNTTNICYASSKGAIITMSRIAAAQLGKHGITVNAVCPGMTETEMMRDWMAATAKSAGETLDAVRETLIQDVALGRTNTVDDIGDSVLFLVSPASRNVTGQSLNVDGGIMWD